MKNLKNTIYKVLSGIALTLVVAGCANILNSPAAPKAKPGKITLTIGAGPARTARPALDQFKKILLAIESEDGAVNLADVDASGGSAEVELPLGVWNITAKAYLDSAGENLAAASEPHKFTWDGEDITGDTRFMLVALGDGPGTLQYTVTVPAVTLAGSGSRIQIELDGVPLEDLDDDGFTDGVHDISATETDQNVSLPAGRYVVAILLENDNNETAVFHESVVILSGLVTKLRYEPDAAAFLDPEARALITEIDSLEFYPTSADEVGIDIGEPGATDDPFVYELEITAPGNTNPVYFTLVKAEGHIVTKSGADGALVNILENGQIVEGDEAGPELAVFAVDTSSVIAEGGKLYFSLSVGEEGKIPTKIAITLTVEEQPLPMLYIDSAPDDQSEILTEVTGWESIRNLSAALEWVNANGVDGGKYVVLLTKESQGEMTDSFSSNETFSNVRITLRGQDEPRPVFTTALDGTMSHSGLFTLNPGTTLVLDENITLDGREAKTSFDNTLNTMGLYFVQVKGGALEMKGGSKITRYFGTGLDSRIFPVFINGGTFAMHGGSIEGNNGHDSIVRVNSGAFAMWDGAKITNNNLALSESSTNNSPLGGSTYTGRIAAVVILDSSVFTMHGGEISNTNYRGVGVIGNSNPIKAKFIMKGGVIKNNANQGFTYNNITYYGQGGGVFLDSGTEFQMLGGEIAGNGVNTAPGSGILVNNQFVFSGDSEEYPPVFLNGAVSIQGNSIAFRVTTGASSGVIIGPDFSIGDNIINVDLWATNSSAVNKTSFITNYCTGKQVLYAADSDGDFVNFNNSNLAAQFVPSGYFHTKPGSVVTEYTGLSGSIDQYGKVAVVSTE
jgi:hypothetical protein